HDAEANVSLWQLLRGETLPSELVVNGAAVTLRFDAAGHLLTRLPRPESKVEKLPLVRIHHAHLALQQEGRPDMVISGVELLLQPSDTGLVLLGNITDPNWGAWTVERGTLNRETNQVDLALKTVQSLHVTHGMLERLPIVPGKTWKQVQCDG